MELIEVAGGEWRARISPRGAQVLEAERSGVPVLWSSPRVAADLDVPGAALRGGVPLCFPWFGRHPDGLPAHGFARNRDWRQVERSADRVTFALDDGPATRALWPHRFHAELSVTLDDALSFALLVENTGDTPMRFTYALHAYLALDATRTRVDGLDGRERIEAGRPTSIQRGQVTCAGPVDAVFESGPDRLTADDGRRRITLDAPGAVGAGMPSAVVWNPGAGDVPGIGDAWRDFVCVERGRIGAAAVVLEPAGRHEAALRMI